mmetsp:Transcript_814/g.1652  ORF Transcript_814/g.1652 Transcript_814/m.1652 type:complete len:237 (+) Transcript_814:56-766(+)
MRSQKAGGLAVVPPPLYQGSLCTNLYSLGEKLPSAGNSRPAIFLYVGKKCSDITGSCQPSKYPWLCRKPHSSNRVAYSFTLPAFSKLIPSSAGGAPTLRRKLKSPSHTAWWLTSPSRNAPGDAGKPRPSRPRHSSTARRAVRRSSWLLAGRWQETKVTDWCSNRRTTATAPLLPRTSRDNVPLVITCTSPAVIRSAAAQTPISVYLSCRKAPSPRPKMRYGSMGSCWYPPAFTVLR